MTDSPRFIRPDQQGLPPELRLAAHLAARLKDGYRACCVQFGDGAGVIVFAKDIDEATLAEQMELTEPMAIPKLALCFVLFGSGKYSVLSPDSVADEQHAYFERVVRTLLVDFGAVFTWEMPSSSTAIN